MNFFTIGLPRTKTLWLTHLLQTDEADCFHEGLTPGLKLPESNKKYVGSCDNCSFFATQRQPLAIIERNPAVVIDDMCRNFDNPFNRPFLPFLEGLIDKMITAMDKLDGRRYLFNDLSDMDCLMSLITYLKPEEEISLKKWYDIQYLIHTHIQITVRNLVPGMKILANHFKTDLDGLYNLMTR